MNGIYRQQATGEFSIYLLPFTPHCGPKSSPLITNETFKYKVSLTYSSGGLDEKGFLLDNTYFRQYFSDLKDCRICISCEKLCQQIASDLSNEVKGKECHSIEVTIYPLEGVEITFVTVPPKDKDKDKED